MREKERERGNYDNRLGKDGERDDEDEDNNNDNRADGSNDNADCNGDVKYQRNNQTER